MTRLEEMLQANGAYCKNPPVDYTGEDVHESKLPKKKIAVFTCMDTRLVELLEPALGLKRGDAKFVKTVGNTLVGPFDGVVRSLMVATYELGIEEIFVVGHDECGMAKTTAKSLIEAMHARGIDDAAIAPLREELVHWADSFSHREAARQPASAEGSQDPRSHAASADWQGRPDRERRCVRKVFPAASSRRRGCHDDMISRKK